MIQIVTENTAQGRPSNDNVTALENWRRRDAARQAHDLVHHLNRARFHAAWVGMDHINQR